MYFQKKRGGNKQPDDIVPSHHHQRPVPLQLRLDDDRIDRNRHHGDEHQGVAQAAAAGCQPKPLVEQEESRTCETQHHTDTACPRNVLFPQQEMSRQDGEHRTEGRDRRSVDRRGIGSSPQQHEHPAIDDQHGHDQDIAEIAQRNAVGLFREKGERNEKIDAAST